MQTNESSFTSFSGSTQKVQYAGFWLRFVACLIDGLLLGFPIGIITGLSMPGMLLARRAVMSDPYAMSMLFGGTFGFLLITFLVVYWLYYALMESSKKQATIGKMALRLKVTNMQGNRIGFGQASGRFFGKLLSHAIFYIGYMMAGWTEKKQALHDMIADTLVVKANPYQVVQASTAEGY